MIISAGCGASIRRMDGRPSDMSKGASSSFFFDGSVPAAFLSAIFLMNDCSWKPSYDVLYGNWSGLLYTHISLAQLAQWE